MPALPADIGSTTTKMNEAEKTPLVAPEPIQSPIRPNPSMGLKIPGSPVSTPPRVFKSIGGPNTPKSRPNKPRDVSPTEQEQEEEEDGEGENQTAPESPTSESRKQAFAQNPLVRSACYENGITPEQFVRSCHRTLSIDIFASKVGDLQGVG